MSVTLPDSSSSVMIFTNITCTVRKIEIILLKILHLRRNYVIFIAKVTNLLEVKSLYKIKFS
jgi:hypothetical protein